jgi:hypothetical protein
MSDTEVLSPEPQVTAESPQIEAKRLSDLITDPELRSHPKLAKFLEQPIETLAKSHIHAEAMIGKRVDQMTAEEVISFNKKLGLPDRSDAYSFAQEDILPQEQVRELKDRFHKAGLNQVSAEHMFNNVIESLQQSDQKVMVDLEAKKEENVNQLVNRFGSNHRAMLDLIEQELIEQGGMDLRNRVLDPVNMDHQLVDMFAKIVKEKRSQGLLQSSPTAPVALSAMDAELEIDRIRTSPEYRAAKARGDKKALGVFSEDILKLMRVKQLREKSR